MPIHAATTCTGEMNVGCSIGKFDSSTRAQCAGPYHATDIQRVGSLLDPQYLYRFSQQANTLGILIVDILLIKFIAFASSDQRMLKYRCEKLIARPI
jgi:hypothetical protein